MRAAFGLAGILLAGALLFLGSRYGDLGDAPLGDSGPARSDDLEPEIGALSTPSKLPRRVPEVSPPGDPVPERLFVARVLDGATGLTVQGAEARGAGTLLAETDEHGEMRGVLGANYQIVIRHPGYADRVVYASQNDRATCYFGDVFLWPAVGVAGRVQRESGAPAPEGMSVSWLSNGRPHGNQYHLRHQVAVTTEGGWFHAEDVWPDGGSGPRRHYAIATGEGLSGGSALGNPDDVQVVTVRQDAGFEVAVVNSDGEPVAGARTSVWPMGEPWEFLRAYRDRTALASGSDDAASWLGSTDESGLVLVSAPGSESREYRLVVHAEGYEPFTETVRLEQGPLPTQRIEVRLSGVQSEKTIPLHVIATLADQGTPLAGAEVIVGGEVLGWTGADGTLSTFCAMGPGGITGRCTSPGYFPASTRLQQSPEGGAVEWRPRLHLVRLLHGVVVDGDGNPLAGARVSCKSAGRPGTMSQVTSEDGSFRFEEVPRTDLRVSATGPEPKANFTKVTLLRVAVENEEPLTIVRERLTPSDAKIELTARRWEDGLPVDVASVAIAGVSDRVHSPEAVSWSEDRAQILHVPMGRWRVWVRDRRGGVGYTDCEVEVPAGTLILVVDTMIETRVVGRIDDGSDPSGLGRVRRVSFVPTDLRWRPRDPRLLAGFETGGTWTDSLADGNFEKRGLAPGEYEVRAAGIVSNEPCTVLALSPSAAKEILLRPGDHTEVEWVFPKGVLQPGVTLTLTATDHGGTAVGQSQVFRISASEDTHLLGEGSYSWSVEGHTSTGESFRDQGAFAVTAGSEDFSIVVRQ